jgi:hypothetical protein
MMIVLFNTARLFNVRHWPFGLVHRSTGSRQQGAAATKPAVLATERRRSVQSSATNHSCGRRGRALSQAVDFDEPAAGGRMNLFFETKKQKTFVNSASAFPDRASVDAQKSFGSFVQERTALLTIFVPW